MFFKCGKGRERELFKLHARILFKKHAKSSCIYLNACVSLRPRVGSSFFKMPLRLMMMIWPQPIAVSLLIEALPAFLFSALLTETTLLSSSPPFSQKLPCFPSLDTEMSTPTPKKTTPSRKCKNPFQDAESVQDTPSNAPVSEPAEASLSKCGPPTAKSARKGELC